MPSRQEYSSGTHFEEAFGYSRAVRIGDHIRIAGTSPIDEGEVVGVGDPKKQAEFVLERIGTALEEVGGTPEDVILTRIFVTDYGHWEAIGEAHRAFFGDVKPATTMVQVDSLPEPEVLLEIEVEAIR